MRNDWIKVRLDELGKSQKALAESMGLPPPRIVDIIGGKRQVLAREVMGMASFLELPAIVILRRMFPAGATSLAVADNSDFQEHRPTPDLPATFSGTLTAGYHDIGGAEFASVGRYDAGLSAGQGSLLDPDPAPEGYHLFEAQWLRAITTSSPDKLAVVRVDGDSMEVTLRDGDAVLVDLAQRRFGREGIYALRVGQNCWVKRLSVNLRSKMIKIMSDNDRYETQEMPEDEVELLGRVVMVVARRL